jgi:hypothetical protein
MLAFTTQFNLVLNRANLFEFHIVLEEQRAYNKTDKPNARSIHDY